MEINDFIQVRELTTNGRKFGSTFLVKHKTSNALGVLKLIKKDSVTNEVLEQLKIEASISFQEKGLPEILCEFENANYFSFVKRYQEGILWKEYADSLSKRDFFAHLPLAVCQIIEILHKVHQQGWLHGDIKPSNILINAKSPLDFQMELIDFGMSFKIGQQPSCKLPFSLGFSPPEIMLNRRDLTDETTDFYSLGITIINLITGEIPLKHTNPELFINLQLTHPIFRPNHIPSSIWNIISKMVVKPSFPMPPNQLSDDEIKSSITATLNERLNYDYLLSTWEKIEIKKGLFGFK